MTAITMDASAPRASVAGMNWFGIFRIGLVQVALGAIVILATSVLNRVMVVELAFPAMLPGALVALHHVIQISRPRMGYGSDVGGRRTPWIVGGMIVLAIGGVGASAATALMETNPTAGIASAVFAFVLIGLGAGAAGTNLLVLLAKEVVEERRPAAASVTWVMMIAGFVVTAMLVGHFLDPFTTARLVTITAIVAASALTLGLVAIIGLETRAGATAPDPAEKEGKPAFRDAMRQVWHEPEARRFTIFIFVSMLAYSGQDLILEPFAGAVFGLTPGESTQLSGVQHGGALMGMLILGVLGKRYGGGRIESMLIWTIVGCAASAVVLFSLGLAGALGLAVPIQAMVFCLGVANGVFAIAAIGTMMALVGAGRKKREGTRMGLWGAAHAVAFAFGGFLGTVVVDLSRQVMATVGDAYAVAFAGESILFLVSAALAVQLYLTRAEGAALQMGAVGDGYLVGRRRG